MKFELSIYRTVESPSRNSQKDSLKSITLLFFFTYSNASDICESKLLSILSSVLDTFHMEWYLIFLK